MTFQPNTASTGTTTNTVFEPLAARIVFSRKALEAFKNAVTGPGYGLERVVNSFMQNALTTWHDKSDRADVRGVIEWGNHTLAVCVVFKNQVTYTRNQNSDARNKDWERQGPGSFSSKRILDKLNNSQYAQDHDLVGEVLYIETLDRLF